MFAFLRSTSFYAPTHRFRSVVPVIHLTWRDLLWMFFICLIVLLIAALPARAGNTDFLTGRNASITFPLSPPNRANSTPGAIDNMTIGATTPAPGTFSQIIPGPGLPTITSGTCGTGTNGAVVAGSTNQSGRITIGAVATTSCPVLFSAALPVAPKACVIAPMNANAAAAGTAGGFVGAPSTTGFTITGLALASTNWSYHCF